MAAALTTVLPTIVGARWISGAAVLRWSVGAVIGIILLAFGGLLGGLAGHPLLGATLLLLVGWLLGPRVRWHAGGDVGSQGVRQILLVIAVAGCALMLMSFFRPVPSWDAWFLWSLKAKGLASAGSFQSPVFLSSVYGWSSQDYPTLLPSWQALAYIASGDLSISWPLQFQQAWLWTAGAIALVALTGTFRRGAFLLPLAWVVSPQVVWQSMQGYADVPMALMVMLGATVIWKDRHDPRGQVLSGVLLAGAALTKSEGTPLVGIVLLCLLFTKKPTTVLALGPIVVAAARLPWFIFTQMHGLTNHIVTSPAVVDLILGRVPIRLVEIISTMAAEAFSPLRWGLLVPGCVVAWALARRLDVRLAVAALLQFALFAAAYAASWPSQGTPLEDFMATNVDRILITPLGVLALAVALGGSRWAVSSESDVSGPSRVNPAMARLGPDEELPRRRGRTATW
jgi:hypothetical protein